MLDLTALMSLAPYAAILVAVGWALFRLPGDLAFERSGFRFFLPLTSMIVVSVIVSVILWLFRR